MVDIKEEARARKSARARRRLRTVIVVVLIIAVGVGAFGIYEMTRRNADPQQVSSAQVDYGTTLDDSGSSASPTQTRVPELASLIGKTVDEAVALLPEGSSVVSTAEATDADVPSVVGSAEVSVATGGTADREAAGDDMVMGGSVGDLYLSLDEAGVVVKVYYYVPLDVIGNDTLSFDALLSDGAFINEVLESAGVPDAGFVPDPPAESAYQKMSGEGSGSKLVEERYTYTGVTNLETAPTTWKMDLVFDYASVNVTGNAGDLVRTMALTLY